MSIPNMLDASDARAWLWTERFGRGCQAVIALTAAAVVFGASGGLLIIAAAVLFIGMLEVSIRTNRRKR